MLPYHFALCANFLEALKPACTTSIIILWGSYVRKWFRQLWTGDEVFIEGHNVFKYNEDTPLSV